ncbi:hypothetical protein [Ferrovibrio sp.]|uniref:hypothetical protein n=1 Tax=Ferrovibrio sp. TaxID=1917215 RepID=UPI0035ADFCB8
MFYQAPDFEAQMDRAEKGVFPLTRSELQPTIDAATEVETSWWESDRMEEFATRQDERIRAITGTGFDYPRQAHRRRFTGTGDYLAALVGDTQDPARAIESYNNDVRQLRAVHPELSDIKTIDEAELEWITEAKRLRDEAAKLKRHSGEGFTDSASLAELWSGVKTGVQEPANIAAAAAGVVGSFAMAPALAASSIFARIGAPVLLDSTLGAVGQYSISDRLEALRVKLGYSPEQVEEMKWAETATAFGVGAVLGTLFEGGSLGVRKLLRGSGKLGEAIDDLNSDDPRVRLKATDEIERMVPLNDNELDLLRDVRRDSMLRLTSPVDLKTEADLRAYLAKLDGAERVARGDPMPANWFERLQTYYDPDAPRLARAGELLTKSDSGQRITLDDIRPALAPDQARRFERELAETPKATQERVTLFDVRDLSNEGRKLFKEVEAFQKQAADPNALEADVARQRAYLLARMETGPDKEGFAWVRERVIRNELDLIKKRVQEVKQITDRTDMLQRWVTELRGEVAMAKLRREADASRPDIVRGANVLSQDARNRVEFGTTRGMAVETLFPDQARRAPPTVVDSPAQAKELFDRLQAQPKPNEAALAVDEAIASGKYDKVIEESRNTLVERYGDREVIDPDTGQRMTMKQLIEGRESTVDALDEILACMMK